MSLLFLAQSAYSQADSLAEVVSSEIALDSVVLLGDQQVPSSDTSLGGNQALWASANKAYIEGQYPQAVLDYEAILSSGEFSSALYFNLGNAYFQQNRLGKALLNYYRARNLDPTDEDILYNLETAQARTKDKIDPIPSFFLVRWIDSLGSLFSSNGWAVLSLSLFLICLVGIFVWLISGSLSLRKLGFFLGFICGVLFFVSLAYSYSLGREQLDESGGVVVNSAAPIKSSPSSGGTDLFILNEGTYLEVLQQLEDWSEIRVADGNKGWILSSAIELL